MASSSVFADLSAFQDQLRGIWRFKWIALIVAWVVALVAWAIVFVIPNKYEATAQVFVDTGTTLSQATQGIGLSDNVNQELQRISAALMGTAQLRKVAMETNLMTGAVTAEQQQAVIDDLSENLNLIPYVDPKNPRAPPTLFTITYRNKNRALSIKVVNRLLNDFVEGSLAENGHGSDQTEQFLRQQVADYGQRLSQTEQQLADFKRRHIGLVPGDKGDAFTQLQSYNSQLVQLQGSLYVAERKRDALAVEMRTGQQFTAGGVPAATAGGTVGGAALDTEQQIALDQQKLDQMLLQYTPQYPDVIALKQAIQELKARQKAEMVAAQKGDVGAASALGLSANPVFQQLEEQYNDEQIEVASIQQQIANLQQQAAALKSKIGAAPQVQAEYAQLTRNYEVTRKQYDALLARLDSTRLGKQAAATGLVDFQVIDPPSAQYTPVSPKRIPLIVAIFFLSIASGLAVAYLLHMLRPVFVSARQLGEVTGLTVLGAVNMAWADRYRTETRRNSVRYAYWAAGLLIVGVAVLLLQGYISNVVGELLA